MATRTALLALLLLALLGSAPAWATTTVPVDLKCPVCGTGTQGVSVLSFNTFGGQDADWCAHSAGGSPVILTPATCPRCLYSDDTDSFEEPLSEKQKAPFLKGDVLRLPPGVERSDALPPWVRRDLIAQTAIALEGPESGVAMHYLEAAWAVRLSDNPFPGWDDAVVEPLLKEVPATEGSIVEKDLATARHLLGRLGSLAPPVRRQAATYAGWTLRDRGENPALLEALPALAAAFPAEEWSYLEPRVRTSVERERTYQREVVARLLRLIQHPEPTASPQARGTFTYFVAELSRRLGEDARAREYFEKAAAVQDMPESFYKRVETQRALVR